jgi:hypothetical protein
MNGDRDTKSTESPRNAEIKKRLTMEERFERFMAARNAVELAVLMRHGTSPFPFLWH